MLQDENIVEKQRGKGLFVLTGAQATVVEREREHFLSTKWPTVLQQISRLNLSAEQLLAPLKENQS
jgi:GntR family transcriptional regulator